MKDISSRADIELLVKEFYSKVRANGQLGPIFDDIIKINWDHHIPILVDFWDTILFDTLSYRRNAMGIHFDVNRKVKLESRHFQTWLQLFDETVDQNFLGDKASLAKKRAHGIADVMSFKLSEINREEQSQEPNSTNQ